MGTRSFGEFVPDDPKSVSAMPDPNGHAIKGVKRRPNEIGNLAGGLHAGRDRRPGTHVFGESVTHNPASYAIKKGLNRQTVGELDRTRAIRRRCREPRAGDARRTKTQRPVRRHCRH